MSRLTKNDVSNNYDLTYPNGDFVRGILPDDEPHASIYINAMTKLGQLEDLEDELGCSILDVFKALKEGIKMDFEGQLIPPKLYYDDVYNQWKFKINYYSTAVGLYNVKDVINGMEEEE